MNEGKEAPILEVRGLWKDFSGLEVLCGIDLTLKKGENHAIIGPNGAGKSTFFNVISGKYRPSRGRIYFKGVDITGLAPHKIARMGLARSFQITNIFRTMTVFENIRNAVLSKKGLRHDFFRKTDNLRSVTEETDRLLSMIGLQDRRNELAGELAHGHQRALEIGLTLALDPELILLDEPTAGMSAAETKETVDLIERVTAGKTLLIVEHDMEVVFSIAERITVLYYGQVLASGSPQEIRKDQRVKDAYLGEERT